MPDNKRPTASTRSVTVTIEPRETDLGDFSVRRLLPHPHQRRIGPWVFFDHFGPVEFAPGKGIDVRPHPHINLATVTFLFDGEVLHRDSLGCMQTITPGAINLMVAGSGIVHSERERAEIREQPHTIHGLQLWLALPQADEEIAPQFLHYPAVDIPSQDIEGVMVTLMIGEAYDMRSPVRTFTDTLYLAARLDPGQRLTLPQAEEEALYVVAGEVEVDGQLVGEHRMAAIAGQAAAVVEAHSEAHVVVIGGASMGERFIDWNFVSSRRERIEQARRDWREGRFPKVPGDEHEFIPLPE